jgi:hypothetical protein
VGELGMLRCFFFAAAVGVMCVLLRTYRFCDVFATVVVGGLKIF